MVMTLPVGVSFAKRAIGPGCWAYDFHHDWLGTLGRIVLTELPGNAHTHVSCELAENSDMALTDERRRVFGSTSRFVTRTAVS